VTRPPETLPDFALPDDALPQLLAELAREHLARDREQPMRPHRTAEELLARLPIAIEGDARPWPEAFSLLREVLAATPSTSSRRFFNQLFGGRDGMATLAELASVLANSPMHTFKASGVQVLIERAVLQRMGALAGMPDGDGLIAPGGSLSNLAAMIMARNQALPGAREDGLPGVRALVYASAVSHYSVRKAAGMVGLGRNAVRSVPIDADGRMRPEALARMIDEDRSSGAVPVMIIATAGTTVLGAFDPLPAIADVAARAGVWLHVDAAYGGSALLSPRHRALLDGCERADSLTWDAHKLLTVPLTCSALLTRRPGLCAQAFDEPATYLFQDDALLDPGRGSLQCGRKNDALKLWLCWKHHGDEGLAQRVDRLFELAAHLAARVQEHPRSLRLALAPASFNVCFEVVGKSSRRVCRELWERSIAQIGHAVVDGREVVRWVLVDPAITPGDLDEVLAELLAVASTLPDEG
jgi:glutamate/tyrosine decarboxylase-like PLP-dependent enzyme